jgi:hypothetical protein
MAEKETYQQDSPWRYGKAVAVGALYYFSTLGTQKKTSGGCGGSIFGHRVALWKNKKMDDIVRRKSNLFCGKRLSPLHHPNVAGYHFAGKQRYR